MRECNNYFYKWRERGTFNIASNVISGIKGKYIAGQYIRIVGSIMNDGVYKVETYQNGNVTVLGLTDEGFTGYVCGLVVPKEFIKLCEDIKVFNANSKPSDITAESFEGYSYTKSGQGWNGAFKNELRPYRKMKDSFNHVDIL